MNTLLFHASWRGAGGETHFVKNSRVKKTHRGVGEKKHCVKKQVWRLQVGRGGGAVAYIVESPSVKKLPVGGGAGGESALCKKKLLVKKRTCKKSTGGGEATSWWGDRRKKHIL